MVIQDRQDRHLSICLTTFFVGSQLMLKQVFQQVDTPARGPSSSSPINLNVGQVELQKPQCTHLRRMLFASCNPGSAN